MKRPVAVKVLAEAILLGAIQLRAAVFACQLTGWNLAASAEVKLRGVFAEHMVLRRDAKVPV